MRVRRVGLRLAGAGLVAAGSLLAGAGSASADSAASVESGWWNEATAGPVVAPGTASSGQLQVSSGLQGPLAFAAVRIGIPPTIDPTSASVTLTLVQVPNSAVGTVSVAACPTTTSWKSGGDQPASSAPGYDCSAGRQAVAIDSDGQDTFSIPAGWASGSTVEVAIVPAPGTTTPFSVDYSEPTTQSAVIAGAPTGPGAPTSPATTAASPSLAPSGSAGPAASTSGSASSSPSPELTPTMIAPSAGSAVAVPMPSPAAQIPSVTPDVTPSLAPGAAPSPVPAPASSPPGGTAAPSSGPVATASQAAAPAAAESPLGPGRAGRILAVSVLLLLGVAMFGLSGYSGRPPRALLPVGMGRPTAPATAVAQPVAVPAAAAMLPVPRGIGRFAKPRTGPPHRL